MPVQVAALVEEPSLQAVAAHWCRKQVHLAGRQARIDILDPKGENPGRRLHEGHVHLAPSLYPEALRHARNPVDQPDDAEQPTLWKTAMTYVCEPH